LYPLRINSNLVAMRSRHILILAVALILSSCIDPFDLDTENYDDVLVVDGMISSGLGPHSVILSKTGGIDSLNFQYYEGCTVRITDDEGSFVDLDELGEGVYQTKPLEFEGVPGRKYSVFIETPEGKSYLSDPQLMLPSVGIDSVYYEYDMREELDFPLGREGYQFFVDTKESDRDSTYFLWRVENTFKFNADFTVEFYYTNGNFFEFPAPNIWSTCYSTNKILDVFTENTLNRSKPRIDKQPLHFEDTYSRALSRRYSLLVEQLVISEKAYDYWQRIRKLKESQGSVFAQQPYQIRGNVYGAEDDEEVILGYFTVAGKSEKRIFLRWKDGPMRYPECQITDVEREAVGWLRFSRANEWPVYLTLDAAGRLARPPISCMDCRTRGGYLNKPAFWID